MDANKLPEIVAAARAAGTSIGYEVSCATDLARLGRRELERVGALAKADLERCQGARAEETRGTINLRLLRTRAAWKLAR